jgi:hypothetical protein
MTMTKTLRAAGAGVAVGAKVAGGVADALGDALDAAAGNEEAGGSAAGPHAMIAMASSVTARRADIRR